MSDDEDMMYDDGDEYFDDDDDQEDQNDEESEGVEIENQYYNSKGLIEDSIPDAIKSYEKVIDLEDGVKGEWGFKALKKITKLNFQIENYDVMLEKYKQFLSYTKSAVTSNYSEKGINSILDMISTNTKLDLDLVQKVYDLTLKCLLDAKNEVCFIDIIYFII
ncbi:hypothetical protein CYY_002782 [Polysphondylium violaceum]|uniref:COP9 signalosome complex subunit 2 n=1 Tax=Polysphondylium violaceum TaxID=133409 RepID=A0A8J4PZM3_9MYCE|nr:hypothetical protein CYY_002782 [Polysphondylium violaceum]